LDARDVEDAVPYECGVTLPPITSVRRRAIERHKPKLSHR